ncbi:MAG: BMP family ABC transporter substrate-binding protein [Alphaproteobacteria bacterium]|nr:BMP family ABC transporter substrate-binding protein [Alphaproteobacteria bacterium]
MTIVSGFKRIALAAMAATALTASGAYAAEEPLKIGFVYVSPVGDAGWTYQHDLGRKQLEAELGDKITTTFVESVPEGADAERVIRDFAADGHELIFTTSFGYMNPTVKVARMFPKVAFDHATGYKRGKNVSTYLARFYEGRYLTGVLAGLTTKSNKIGYIAAFPIPEVVRGINAFTRGLRSVNPDADVNVVWVSSWYDPGKEREAAETLIAQGADIVTQHTDSTAPVQAAEDRGVHAIGYHSDMSKYGPNAHLTATTHHWGDFYISEANAVMDGTWESTDTWGGIKEGMIKLAPFGPGVSDETKKVVAEREAAIASGELHPFAGPVKDQAGTVRIAEGEVMSDGDMLGFDWYVEGVVGELPN